MGEEIWRPFFTSARELALTVNAMCLGMKSSILRVNARQRWQHECLACGTPIDSLIHIIAVNLGAAHLSALVHVFRNGSASWIKVVREADNVRRICVPKWAL